MGVARKSPEIDKMVPWIRLGGPLDRGGDSLNDQGFDGQILDVLIAVHTDIGIYVCTCILSLIRFTDSGGLGGELTRLLSNLCIYTWIVHGIHT